MSRSVSPGAVSALALLAIVWGYNWVLTKVALSFVSALSFAALRTVIGAAALFGVLVFMRRSLRPASWWDVAVLGLLQTTGFMAFSLAAMTLGGAGETAVLVYTMPFWVALLAWPLLGERVGGREAGPILTALVGLVLILAPWSWRGDVASKLLAVLAGVSWALSVIYAKRLRGAPDLLNVTAWQMLLGAVPLAVLVLAVPGRPAVWSPVLIGVLAFNIVVSLGWVLWLYVLKKLPAGAASMGTLATPVIGAVAAWVQLGETPDPHEGAGMLLIAAALAWMSIQSIRLQRRVQAAMAQE